MTPQQRQSCFKYALKGFAKCSKQICDIELDKVTAHFSSFRSGHRLCIGPQITTTWVRISACAYLKGVCFTFDFASLHLEVGRT